MFTSLLVGSTGCFKITNPDPEVDAGGPVGSSIAGQIYTRSGASATGSLAGIRAGLTQAKARAESGDVAHISGETSGERSPLLVTAPSGRDADNTLAVAPVVDIVAYNAKNKAELSWMPSEMMVLMERHAIPRSEVDEDVRGLVASLGLDVVVHTQVTLCTAGRFCLVRLRDAQTGKPLDGLETARVVDEVEDGRRRLFELGATKWKAVSRNFLKHSMATPNDQFYVFQWHYEAAGLTSAWDYSVGSDDVIVAVIDSGLRFDHPDIIGKFKLGADLITDPQLAIDGDGRDVDATDPGDQQFGEVSSWHGSHVAGTIAAGTNNQIGVSGILWQGYVLPVRVLGLQGNGTDFDILSGLFYAVSDPEVDGVPTNPDRAKILNISIGGPSTPEAQQFWIDTISALTITEAAEYGNPIIVVATGNENQDVANSTPANVPGVIAVGATNYLGQRATYSNYGPLVTIMAPGGQTEDDYNNDTFPDGVLSLFDTAYNFIHGTSMSTPHVSGILGLVVAIDPTLTQQAAKQLLTTNANPAGQCAEGCGAGSIEATALVLAAGAQPDALPRLSSDEYTLIFQPGDFTGAVTIRNTGGTDLQWESEVSGAQKDLFVPSPVSGTLIPGGAQVISVQLNRGDFEAGSANLFFNGIGEAQGQSVRVDLGFADKPPPPAINLQQVEVQLYKVRPDNTLQQTNQVFIARAPDFDYRFTGLEPGDYQIFAVGDDNNDNIFNPQSESVGAWPLSDGPETFTVDSQTQYTSISFGLSGGFVIGAVGNVGAACIGDGDCDFAPDAVCIIDTQWQGGYCTRQCLDGRCNGGVCESLDCETDDGTPCYLCLSSCVTSTQCRSNEAYVCDSFGTCLPPF